MHREMPQNRADGAYEMGNGPDADSAVSMRSDTTQVVPSPPGLLGNPADLAEFGMSRPARTIVT